MCHGSLHGLGDQGSIKLSAPNFVPEQTLFENTTGLEEHVAWGCHQLLPRRSSSPTSSQEGSDPTARPRPAPPTGSTKPLPRRAGLPGGRRGEQSWYLRKRARCQSPGTPAASHRCRQLLHPRSPNCALPVARAAPRRAALHRCARSAARRPPLSSAAPPPAPPQPLAHWLQECLAPPLGAGPLLGRARGWGPKLGEASCGHRELLLCQPRNRQLQRKAREEASSSGRGPWLGGTGSLGWNIEIIARGLGVGWFVGLL